ncbi:GAF domain-containing protein [Sorangium sp. So ce136]|uniref:GAF domain-containing protein n=1 Tax=Sorangium sp. So ce136 TaxID=3133284 RepID=UPI003F108533
MSPRSHGSAAPLPPMAASLDEVLVTEKLARRPARLPDHAAENRALLALATAMAGPLEDVLPRLVSLLLELCRADSAGVSVLEEEDGQLVFRWRAIAGAFAPNLGGTMPRTPSLCGTVLDRDEALLFSYPARHFAADVQLGPPVVEALTAPFHDGDTPIGTVWVIAHTEERKFDAEDARLLSSVSRFAATAVRALARAQDAWRAAEALRVSEGRHRFLADLAAATQPLVDPDEVMAVTARMLAEHLGADRCAYAEVEDERIFVITGDYTRDVPSIVGRWPVADFGPECVRLMLANEPYVMSDVDVDPRAGQDLSAYRATTIQAVICVPLHKSGRFTAAMAVHQNAPRRWTPDEVGLVQLVVGRCWEAIERARAARGMRERDERLDYAVRLSGIGFWYCDLPFDELIWDERVKDHFWFPKDARVTIGAFYDRLHPDDRGLTRRAIEASIRERIPYDIDYRTVDPATGAIKWVRALGGTAYAPDGTPRRFDGVTVDITDRKRDEERLARLLDREREQGRLLRQVADAALTIHASGSLDSVLQGITEQARRIIGAHQAVASLAAGGGGRDGDARPPAQGRLVAPFIGRSGEDLGFIQLSDKHEGEFTESDEAILVQLAHIASVAIENARLYDQLRDQDRRKDEFLATLAHELRNPLAPIRTGLEILQVSGSAEQDRKILAMIERQVGHMVRMVDDLLDVSRITRGKVELRRERVDLRAVLNSALETSRPLLEAAEHELAVRLPAEPLLLDADPTRLAQVFANLLNNAAKYTPGGGVIRLAAQRDGAAVVVRVMDNGVGIPADMLPKVFDMFTQVVRSIDRAQGGLGIGLTLVRRLVELHGGTVHAESEGPGRGSTFTVRLPLAAVALAAPEGPASRPRSSGPATRDATAALRVLVVDDNVDGAESLALLLRMSGHRTRAVHTGPEALTAARELGADIVFLDIGLPGMDGYEVARRLRADPGFAGLVLVALTGWGTEDDRRRAREAGFDHHLTKPVDAAEVRRLVARVAQGAAAGRQGG